MPGVDDAGEMEDGRTLGAGTEPADRGGIADVPFHQLHRRKTRGDRLARGARQDEAAHMAVPGARRARRIVGVRLVQEVHEPVAQPPGESGDERDAVAHALTVQRATFWS